MKEIVVWVAKLTRHRRWIIGLPDFFGRMQAFFMNFVPGRPFSGDNYKSLTVDSVCREDGFARLGIQPKSMGASARPISGDNSRKVS